MTILDQLFTFPIILLNVENEDMKNRLGLPSERDTKYDMLEGEAKYPYFEFIGIEDRWIPNDESLESAREGIFNACAVKFANMSQLLVPWPKEKFEYKLRKFTDEVNRKKKEEQAEATGGTILLSPIQARKIGDLLFSKTEEDKGEEGKEEKDE